MISLKYSYLSRYWTHYCLGILSVRLTLALRLLEACEQRGEPVKPRSGISQLQDQLPGMFYQTAGEEDHTGHHGLDPASGGFLQSQGLLDDHILRNNLEHIIGQHAHKQKASSSWSDQTNYLILYKVHSQNSRFFVLKQPFSASK